jgi:alpha-glucosidase
MADPNQWWREGVLYQIYPRSYADANGDGVGDLAGITGRLDHLEWLGVRGIWLSPVTVSPNADFGYDVADYCDVDPSFGTLADLDALVAEAGRRGIRVLMDLVPNHTSIEHPWFRAARSSRDDPKRDWYVWADPAADGGPPNNWVSSFGGPAWTLDETTGQYYLHNFLAGQPDLNWWNDDVRAEFDRILRFWFDRGIAGFRVDVAHMIVKDRELRDNPPATDTDPFLDQVRGQRPIYNTCRPEVHDVHRRWRAIAETYDPPRLLVGETFLPDLDAVLAFYGAGDEMQLSFNIPFAEAEFSAPVLRELVRRTEAAIPAGCTPVWVGSNHDIPRFPTRWAEGDPARARAALLMLLTLRGTTFLFQGDEIGMVDTPLAREQLQDPVGIRFYPVYGRDPERTPMQWRDAPGAGFTTAGVEPWLPFGDLACNVEAQRDDPDSFLTLCRDLIALRAATPDLAAGGCVVLDGPDAALLYRRGDATLVAVAPGPAGATVEGVQGSVLIATRRARAGEAVAGALTLAPGEAVVVALA